MASQLIAVFAILLVSSSLILAAPLQRPRKVLLKSESQQFLRVTLDGVLRNDAGRATATCFEMLRPQKDQLMISTTIGDVKHSLVMDSNGEVTTVPEADNVENAEGASEMSSGSSGFVYYDTFNLIQCPFLSTTSVRPGKCLKINLDNELGECYLNFNSSNMLAKYCTGSPAPTTSFKALQFVGC